MAARRHGRAIAREDILMHPFSALRGKTAARKIALELSRVETVPSSKTGRLPGRRPFMFESTQEAQALDHGERNLGTFSAAVLAHVGIGLAIVLATALIVPPVHPPDAPSPVFVFTPNIRLDDVSPRLTAPAPKKGANAAEPRTAIAPPPVAPVAPPAATPDTLPAIAPDAAPQREPERRDERRW
jgi:hypothetical protein